MRKRDLLPEAEAYAGRRGLVLSSRLGRGLDGNVWVVRRKGKLIPSALKIQSPGDGYQRERDAYLRLGEYGITKVAGFNVPVLLHHDDQAGALEMTIVARPFVLDFAQAFLDEKPDFPEKVWPETHQRWRDCYGSRWPEVQRLLLSLEDMGIFYLDVHQENIAVED